MYVECVCVIVCGVDVYVLCGFFLCVFVVWYILRMPVCLYCVGDCLYVVCVYMCCSVCICSLCVVCCSIYMCVCVCVYVCVRSGQDVLLHHSLPSLF